MAKTKTPKQLQDHIGRKAKLLRDNPLVSEIAIDFLKKFANSEVKVPSDLYDLYKKEFNAIDIPNPILSLKLPTPAIIHYHRWHRVRRYSYRNTT